MQAWCADAVRVKLSETAGERGKVTWSFGEIFAGIGGVVDPDTAALIHGDHVTSWRDFDRRTDALAAAFLAAGAVTGDKVAHLMRNSPAYLETTIAAFKARLVHVNVSYRYTGSELFYILDNSDAAVVVYDAEFAGLIDAMRDALPKVKSFIQVGGEADEFEAIADAGAALPPQSHRPDDMLFIYTGGTTGLPKGVMWDQAALFTLLGGGAPAPGEAMPATLADHFANIAAGRGRQRSLIMPPLMHGSGFVVAIATLARGGCVVTLASRGFEPSEVFAVCAKYTPDYAVIVGDAFARPLLRALDAGGGSIASLNTIISSGTMWSPEIKAGLLRHNPALLIIDALGSSESIGMGVATQTSATIGAPTRFIHDTQTRVLDDQLRRVAPGSGIMGRIARGGLMPRGYYKDLAKTAATFIEVDGERLTLAGDWATVDADGTIILLGRGSQCINTGGEKVFPEEVEEALKTHPAVEDALVFGTAHPEWGQAVTAVVEGALVDTAALIAHVRTQLAGYKTPKRIVMVEKVPRGPNGKPDYARAQDMAG